MDESNSVVNSDYQQGFDNYVKMLKELDKEKLLNEAQTRFEIIDTILYDCLGWSKYRDIKVEDFTEKGYADYIISTSRDVVVLEAKRQSIYFEIPVSSKPVLASINSIIKGNDSLRDAINQAKEYAQSRGVPIAIVSNGRQYVSFIASRDDGQAPSMGYVIAFTSLEQISDNYIEFWNYFSKEGNLAGNLHRTLLKGSVPELPVKPSSFVMDYPGNSARNGIQNDMMVLSEMVLEDFIHEEELEKQFLKHCYCDSGALSQYSVLARNIIKNRYEQIDDTTGAKIERISSKKGISKEFLNASISRRPIILIGDVGVGKTTFIRKLILSDDGILGRNDIAIHVNLGENAILSTDVKTGSLLKIKQILLDDYDIDIHENEFVRGVYKDELQRMKNGIYKNLAADIYLGKEIDMLEKLIENDAEHIKKSIDYIETRNTHKLQSKVVIFLDNADQRNSKDQQEIFLIAHELSAQSMAAVFVSIRPETFYLSHREGVLKAYHPKIFTIEPPRIDLVLQRRIKFALMISKGEIPAPSLGDQKITLSNLTVMLEVMLRTLESQRDEQKNLMATIDNIAAGNVRSAVDMVKNFLSSAHTNTKKILSIEEESPGAYFVPMHEFMRSLIYGDNKYYNPDVSVISNVFSISSFDSKEYFLKLILINELIFRGSSEDAKQGFVNTKIVYSYLQALGYLPVQVDKVINYCLKDELIENPINSILKDSDVADNAIRITTRGAVYVSLLAGNFQYIDAMLIDIPIIDKILLERLNKTYCVGDIDVEERLLRTEAFVNYLDEIYKSTPQFIDDIRVSQLVNQIMTQFSLSVQKTRDSIRRTASRAQLVE